MIHNISYRTFFYGTEDEEKVMKSINHIFPNSSPDKKTDEDHFGNEITIISDKITRKRATREIISLLNERLSDEDKNLIKEELSRRMDDKGNLFLRFDKQLAYDETIKLRYSGDVIHVRIKIASYPVNKENAIKVAHEIFDFLN